MLGVPEEQVPGDLRWCGVDGPRVVGGIGRTFIAAGTLILLFVAYQLWGTGLAEARSQDRLRSDFLDALEAPPSRDQPEPAPPDGTEPTEAPAAPPPAPTGEAVAIMRIPKIGVEKAVVEGVSVPALKHGPGHYPRTPLPGQRGNSAIAGHRTTYGAPFFRLDELVAGDEILVTTRQGEFTYEVTERMIVRPSQNEVLAPSDDNRLTLTTCHPRFSAAQRLIVVATLKDDPAPAPGAGPPPAQEPPGEAPPGDDPPAEDPADEPPADDVPGDQPGEAPVTVPEDLPEIPLDEATVSGQDVPRGPAVLWGLLSALVWIVTWLLSKRWGRVTAYLMGTPVFLVVLFVFFENFARLLPANI